MRPWQGIVGVGFSPDAFENYVSTLQFGAWRPQFVVLHNTAVPQLSEWHSVSGIQRMHSLVTYYRDEQKWSAGPHLFVADDQIWVFTPLTTYGIHSPSWNHVSWGVEMVGNFEVEAFDSGLGLSVHNNTISALATLHTALGIDSATLRFHKEDPLTTHNCPGSHVHKEAITSAVHDAIVARHGGDHLLSRFQ